MTRAEQIYTQFVNFHQANPNVYQLFEQFTIQLINAGFKHYGGQAVTERIRWHINTQTEDPSSTFKINDMYVPYYTRMFEAKNPQNAGFFHRRKRTSTAKQVGGMQTIPPTESQLASQLAVL